ncbi:unnamed protein product [Moneuplotes crassus]|uniref:3'-5' exonuclease domain-containing protein n=1 Tax=Euplotes crassus TaxID=5936 RepID=A0AAD1UIH5_EUPCR|nr:unnamed protein product [Moneuplotes crassus]
MPSSNKQSQNVVSPVLVATAEQAIEVIDAIKAYSKENPTEEVVLGMDCEGIQKDKPLALFQMFLNGSTYIFDVIAHNPFELGLKEILESDNYIKVFHDFCEDSAALFRHFQVSPTKIFDTQIAHRVKRELEETVTYQDNNISLNNLLKTYMRVENTMKTKVNSCMTSDPEFWYQRPMTHEMLEYASQDVIYLPEMYRIFIKSLRTATVAEIFQKSSEYLFYSLLNSHTKDFTCLSEGDMVGAYIKNYYGKVIFCSLNLGCSGIIRDEVSCEFIHKHFNMGDLINLEVSSIDYEKKFVTLVVPDNLLFMEESTVKGYYKLAKMSQESKVKKMVEALNKKSTKKPRKTSMSLTSKKFFPKIKRCDSEVKSKSGSFDETTTTSNSEISCSA